MGLGLQISAWQLIDCFCNQNTKNIAHTLWAILCINQFVIYNHLSCASICKCCIIKVVGDGGCGNK
jgi:hypothetical protein